MIKRAKGPLFTPYEKHVLTEKADRHMEILDNKCNNSKTIFLKQQTWNLITGEFNNMAGVTPRSKKQLKNLWKNMKCRAKYRSMASMRFLNTNYGDLNPRNGVLPQLQGVPGVDNDEADFPVNVIIKEEPNDDESDGSARQSTEQQSRDEMSVSDSASPERSRSPEASIPTVSSEATNSTSGQMQHDTLESSDRVNNARIPTYKAIQPKFPLNSALQAQLNSTYAGIVSNPPLPFSTESKESPRNTFRQPPITVPHVKLDNTHCQSSVLKNKWRTEPAWTLRNSQNSDKIIEMAETEHKRKMEMMEKEHETKMAMMEKEHQRKLQLFSLKEDVLLLKKQKVLNKLSVKNESNNILASNEMQPF